MSTSEAVNTGMVRDGATTEVGIVGLSVYIPSTAVCQHDLEQFDGVSTGKYTIGLGQSHMSFVTDREDVVSLALTALDDLVCSYGISYNDIGRLEVGTETIIDKSKSIKSALMQLFELSGNFEVEGLDNTNACYGGTAALFNTAAWIESSAWDGRYGVVVTSDIAVYAPGPARATGGAAAVAILIGRGKDVVLRFERGLRATHMQNTHDFFKPNPKCEYPVVDGRATIDCYVRALDKCYALYAKRAAKADGTEFNVDKSVDYCLFHAPFNKMVRKAIARLIYNDFLCTTPATDKRFEHVEKFRQLDPESSHWNREATAQFVNISQPTYEAKCADAAWLAREIGNCYTASLYSSLAALLAERGERCVGKRLLLFSFGSGYASSMFSLRACEGVGRIAQKLRLREQLAERTVVSPKIYDDTLRKREDDYGRSGYTPQTDVELVAKGAFYINRVKESGERVYARIARR